MQGTSEPSFFGFDRGSYANGDLTWYEFEVTTTNYLVTGDILTVKLPYPVYFTEQSYCNGTTNNVEDILDCTISKDLTTASINLDIKTVFRRLDEDDDVNEFDDDDVLYENDRRLVPDGKIKAGTTFKF